METTLIAAGVVFVGAAIVGGGMIAFKVEVPLIDSLPRQVLLAVFGVALLIAGFVLRGVERGAVQPTSTAESTTQAVQSTSAAETTTQAVQLVRDDLVWIHNPATGHYYALTEPGRSWTQLVTLADQLGGNLVSIGDANEEEWLYSQFGPDPFWIGFTDQAAEGSWVWTTGEPVGYLNWCAGEPTDVAGGAGTEDAAHVIPIRSCWNDEPVWVTEFLDAEQGVTIPSYPGVIEIDHQPS